MSVANSFDMIIRLPESGPKIACKYVSTPVLLNIPEMEGNGVKFDVRYVLLLRSIRPLKLYELNRVLREERFGGCLNFALVELRDEAQRMLFATVFRALKSQILHFLTKGLGITSDRIYRYLHHSQSQLKEKQYWFYWHDAKTHSNLSFEEAYRWMGDFENERVVAKHSARIAQCFTSSEATIRVPNKKTEIINDSKRS